MDGSLIVMERDGKGRKGGEELDELLRWVEIGKERREQRQQVQDFDPACFCRNDADNVYAIFRRRRCGWKRRGSGLRGRRSASGGWCCCPYSASDAKPAFGLRFEG